MSGVPTTICVVWKSLSLLYWLKVYERDSWDVVPPEAELVVGTFCASVLCDWVIWTFALDLSLPYALLWKVLNQCFLIGCLILTHRVLEKQESQMSLRHRVCYALLVENCVAYNLTWNYIQTATLLGALLAQDFDIGPDTVSSLFLILLAICVLATVSVELVFRGKLRWTVASYPPLVIWAFSFRHNCGLDETFLYGLLFLIALLMLVKIAPVTRSRSDFSQAEKKEEIVEDKLLEMQMS